MKWIKQIGNGVALFALEFLLYPTLIYRLKLSDAVAEVTMFIAFIVLLIFLTRVNRFNMKEAFLAGILWMAVYAALDFLVFYSGFGFEYLTVWLAFLWYALIVIVPTLVGFLQKH